MMNHDSKRPVTLEDLLRLKRAERPSAEFWGQFDRELRAKQLAALVEKRPWWTVVPRAFTGFSRYHLPLGAAAVLALTLVSVHEWQPALPAAAVPSSAAKADTPALVAVATPQESKADATLDRPVPGADTAVALADEREADARVSEPVAVDVGTMTAVASTDDFAQRDRAREIETAAHQAVPSVRALTGNALTLHGAETAFARDILATPHGSEVRLVASNKQRVDPLAQMTPPNEARRSSLFNASFTAPTYAPTSHGSSSRLTRGLSDEQLYDTVSRIGARGNSVSLKL